jgi:two-component system, OmpR family, response regulator
MLQRILLVEDDEPHLEALSRALAPFRKFTVEVAKTADDAISKVDASPEAYALVFLDLNMPGEPGSEVLRHIRRANLVVPVIVITASDTQADVYAIYRGGANAYIVKNVDRDSMERDLAIAAKFWLGINRLPGSY